MVDYENYEDEDNEERSCIITTILSLRIIEATSGQQQHRVSKSGSYSDSDCDSFIRRRPCPLPDAIVQHGILSYRPFASIKVVLIRSSNNEQDHHLISRSNKIYHKNKKNNKNKYTTLVFRSNRGPIRFRVTELLYLPQNNNNDDNDEENDEEEDKHKDDIFKNADGVIISCYIRRFHEYCNRYEYANSLLKTTTATTTTSNTSSNNNNDVTATIATATGTRTSQEEERRREGDDDEVQVEGTTSEIKKKVPLSLLRKKINTVPTAVVLCGNDIDVTHIDAKYSSIVFTTNNTAIAHNQSSTTTTTTTSTTTSSSNKCHTTFTDISRHPFASLARNITNDNDLDFITL